MLGLDETVEGEEPDEGNAGQAGDKESLELPLCQQKLLEAVATAGKPVVTVLMSGSAMDLRYADQHTNAVLEAWYPGAEGGTALADILFGKVSPSGKLPVTFYYDTDDLPEFIDYSMENRTYRYMKKEALYPFGFGLTYGDVFAEAAEFTEKPQKHKNLKLKCTVKNEGLADTDDVVQVYIKDWKSKYAVRNYHLCAFKRVHLNAGEKETFEIEIDKDALQIVDEEGKRYIDSDEFSVYIGTSQPDRRSERLLKRKPLELRFNIE